MKIIPRSFLLFTIVLATSLHAEVDLEQFTNVTTEALSDQALGVALEYPYRWDRVAGPSAKIDLFITADSYNLPSFSVIAEDASTSDTEDSSGTLDLGELAKSIFVEISGVLRGPVPAEAVEYDREIEFVGRAATEIKLKFRSPYGEQIPLQAVLIAFQANGQIYILSSIDRYAEDSLGEGLLVIRNSFRLTGDE